VAALGAGLAVLTKAERSLVGHGWDVLLQTGRRWLAPRSAARKAVLAASAVACVWFVFGQMEYKILVPCQVVAREARQLSAPFEGAITASLVQPGDRVRAGQLLLQMDVRPLELERSRLAAQRQIAEVELAQRLQERDLTGAAAARLQAETVRAELSAVELKIGSAGIRAPVEGTILTGDLDRRRDQVVALGEPLLELAPLDRWQIELEAPEHAATLLAHGQEGEFLASGRPEEAQPCRVSRVGGAAAIVDGRNVFLADADLERSSPWLRAGMTGYARIDIGRQPVWWVVLHRLVDTVRLQLWKL
jgi:multidrug resistance efflux pump